MSNVPTPFIQLRKQRDFSETISTGFQFVRVNWKGLYRPLVFIGLPLQLVASLLLGGYFRTTMALSGSIRNGNFDATGVPGQLAGALVSLFIGYALQVIASIFVLALIFEYMRFYQENQGLQPTTNDMWRAVRKQFFPYLAIGIICGILCTLGFILLIIPGIYLAITFSLALPLRSFEGADVGDAISRSFKLISGKWWRTAVMIFLLSMLAAVLVYVLYIPLMMLTGFSAFSNARAGRDPAEMMEHMGLVMSIFTVVASVMGLLLQPLVLVPLGVNAYALIERKEGRGLMDRVDEVSFGPQA